MGSLFVVFFLCVWLFGKILYIYVSMCLCVNAIINEHPVYFLIFNLSFYLSIVGMQSYMGHISSKCTV